MRWLVRVGAFLICPLFAKTKQNMSVSPIYYILPLLVEKKVISQFIKL